METNCDLICVLGPTASGKTAYAVRLAASYGFDANGKPKAEILSADSRQVYRGMDIGTGKDLDEYDFVPEGFGTSVHIPYHLIDIVDAGTKYNIFEYQRDFEAAYRDVVERGRIPILCGGSGLYIEAATQGYSLPEVPSNPELRTELEKQDTGTLVAKLASLKPMHNTTDYDTRKRLIRALEIAIYQREHSCGESHFLPKVTRYIGLKVSPEERNAKIDRRLEYRLGHGMVDEVRHLLESGIKPEDLVYYGLEYKFVTMYLTGELDYGTMCRKLAVAIHQFAKRQMTWFRGMERRGIKIEWV
ncbi:MAG: tRNA (adenosine(37)-N6)-dimethylallyltransferase MiaA [Bacteroidales bacterium]|jgi:tRNA dimethylallyltransferase|nr:tRNA (adenosine(37)-N6)-dimethylallyltransferase MiaA [Bacteroidales bacterium]MCI2121091.1 tRNA (adenosine(37)-N6)-dimethylallyltransferase MiaA [Bacteroidales bacterium]MCI2144906.1 tRNA (adenosine(37)-N6)-dimethylallyltransferase MiaA [Bacteroidales bacterium]